MAHTAIVVPSTSGRDAREELGRVPWGELAHAYGTGVVGEKLHQDVERTLFKLADPDPEVFEEAMEALTSNVFHQGTIYEATPHAVPFLAAYLDDGVHRCSLMAMLGEVSESACFETEDGCRAGAFGEDVGERTFEAVRASDRFLAAAGARCERCRELAAAVRQLAAGDEPSESLIETVRTLTEQLWETDGG